MSYGYYLNKRHLDNMIPNFPLYEELKQKAIINSSNSSSSNSNSKNEEPLDWRYICSIINSLSLEYAELIYVLILHHYLNELKDKSVNLESVLSQIKLTAEMKKTTLHQPYNVKLFTSGKGLTFTVTNLPPLLQRIIFEFIISITS